MDKKDILSAHVLLHHKNTVLLVQHGEESGHINSVYGIPGGRLNKGESFIEAAIREFQEETGLTVKERDLRGYPNNSYTADILRKNGKVGRYTMTVFVSSKFTGTLHSSDETIPEWVDISLLENYNLLPNVKKAIEESRNYI